ncbi:unnamed protein product [Rotaria socialis]|uniref:Uncharacterized protein n=1 Tax=Rotaria socialis TaxID=392032 RepID=A0A821LIU3_9BILA|nr:unnamed protein product [Rotaria socialis]CAF4751634.1 unnamed protein product [Rotaria socialis]
MNDIIPVPNSARKTSAVDEIISKLKDLLDYHSQDAQTKIAEEVQRHSLTKNNLIEAQEKLSVLQHTIEFQCEQMNVQQQTITKLGDQIGSQQQTIAEQGEQIRSQQQTIGEQGEQIRSQQQTIGEQEKRLNLQNDKLEYICQKLTDFEETKKFAGHANYWKALVVVMISVVMMTVIHRYLKL